MTRKRKARDVGPSDFLHPPSKRGIATGDGTLPHGRTNAEIAQTIQQLRTEARLSQRALADLVGTTASVICRLEDATYGGHSLAMLKRVAAALDRRVEVRFVPADGTAQMA